MLDSWILIVFISSAYASEYHVQTTWPTPTPGECNVQNPLSCNLNLLEVCVFRNGTYICECPPNHSRLPDGRCLVANECFDKRMNDCSQDATCTDTLESYTCTCKEGFTDVSTDKQKPGRLCKQMTNECANPDTYKVDCHSNAKCQDTPESYSCSCNSGYVDVSERYSLQPGRRCDRDVDPCAASSTNDCSPNATCSSSKTSYTCQCKPGYNDVSPDKNYPGRDCRPQESQLPSGTCDPKKDTCTNGEQCIQSYSGYVCQCPSGTTKSSDNRCVNTDLCASTTDCDPNANCISRSGSYDCQCKAGYTDTSPDPNKRGRKCVLPEDKCSSQDKNDCSFYAVCHPTINSYECECKSGYLDVSACTGKKRGRVCIEDKNECSDRHLHSCDPNADCVKKPDGYACLCQSGYTDVSSSANLPPGRICSLQTNCPNQPTDLIFLVDGSGSIGSIVFKSDVLRFLTDFITLFKISSDQTRIGVIQFSDLIRKEFDLNQFPDSTSLQQAINNIQYLAGLTSTGKAIDYMMSDGFNENHGARSNVRHVAIVITDGRAQDNVAEPAARARKAEVLMFAVGVTDHVQAAQLEEITGNSSRVFIVGAFKDLNSKLKAVIQKELCPPEPPPTKECQCPDCDPGRNYMCKDGKCVCPPTFCEDTVNKICGAQMCNPDLPSLTCPYPMECKETPFKNFRCACPYTCQSDGSCVSNTTRPSCPSNQTPRPDTSQCEECRPPCDPNKNQVCQKGYGGQYSCGCKERYTLDPVTGACGINECLVPGLSNCSQFAICTDTIDSFFCTCLSGYKDVSTGKPGTVCEKIVNPCESTTHNCSKNADCIPNSLGGYCCACKDGYVDRYPPKAGTSCDQRINECEDPSKNTCSKNADCVDLEVGYKCVCKKGYHDVKPEEPGRECVIDPCQDTNKNDCWLRRCKVTEVATSSYGCEPCPSGYVDGDTSKPGRTCQPKVQPCAGKTDCDANAYCSGVTGKPDDYTCTCRDGYTDVSPDRTNKPGRKCDPINNPCLDVTKNDCDPNAKCTNLGNNCYNCTCNDGFRDKSPDKSKPGRLCRPFCDECKVPQLNNCSSNAYCTDLEDGYTCTCKDGYKDKSQYGLSGRICDPIVDPCSKCDCDIHATCTRVGETGYNCECRPPYVDITPQNLTRGRICKYDGCRNITCNEFAYCENRDEYYICKCKEGYTDMDPSRPGTKCIKIETCGGKVCNKDLGLECSNKTNTCGCKEGWEQVNETGPCSKIIVTTAVPRNYCADFPDCPKNNGTCVNYRDYAYCECNKTYVDLRKYPSGLKRICHGDSICLLDVDVDYCCLQIHNCHLSALCVRLPAGGYQCSCPDARTIVSEGIACPPIPPQRQEGEKCSTCNYHGDCVFDNSGKATCICATWYTGSTCSYDVRIILAIIFAILFLLLSLCCLLYFCWEACCAPLFAKRKAVAYREMSSEGLSDYGKQSDLYQPYTIPRARLKDTSRDIVTEDITREQRQLDRYLERVPSVERMRGDQMAVADVAPRLAAREEEWETESEVSSAPSMQEQYERRVTTDYKKTTTTTGGGAAATTTEFHVFSPTRTETFTSSGMAGTSSGMAGTSGGRSVHDITTTTRYENVADEDQYSEEGSTSGTASTEETVQDTYDKRTLVKRGHQLEPDPSGRGGTERFTTEVSSSSKSNKWL